MKNKCIIECPQSSCGCVGGLNSCSVHWPWVQILMGLKGKIRVRNKLQWINLSKTAICSTFVVSFCQ